MHQWICIVALVTLVDTVHADTVFTIAQRGGWPMTVMGAMLLLSLISGLSSREGIFRPALLGILNGLFVGIAVGCVSNSSLGMLLGACGGMVGAILARSYLGIIAGPLSGAMAGGIGGYLAGRYDASVEFAGSWVVFCIFCMFLEVATFLVYSQIRKLEPEPQNDL